MHSFVDLDRVLGAVPAPLVMTLRDVDRGQGSEGLFLDQVPDLLTELADRARVASITASSALEGVVVKNRSRAAAIIANQPIELRTRRRQWSRRTRADERTPRRGRVWRRPLRVARTAHRRICRRLLPGVA